MNCTAGVFTAWVPVNSMYFDDGLMNELTPRQLAVPDELDLSVEVPIPVDAVAQSFVIGGRPVTYINRPQPYVLVTVPATGFFDDTTHDLNDLEELRLEVCDRLAIAPTPTMPKLGLIATGDATAAGVDRLFRSRIGHGEGWHRGAAGSGITTAATAAEICGATPTNSGAWLFDTPAGPRPIVRRVVDDAVLLTIHIHIALEGTPE